MILKRNLDPKLTLLYSWQHLSYYLILAIAVYVAFHILDLSYLAIPVYTITILSTALAIFLGFNNNQAYDRWWEARKIWGLLVNYSRAWARQVITFFDFHHSDLANQQAKNLQKRMVDRHAAFVHALRIFLRSKHTYNRNRKEFIEGSNDYQELAHLLEADEFTEFVKKDNPPNFLIQQQGKDLKFAQDNGWINDFRFMQLDQTLTEFNNIQGRSERIKNTPMPRNYGYFARIFVFIHATILPFVLVQALDWMMIPISFLISFVFLALDIIGERTQDPFENRMEDTPMTALSKTIERNVMEQWGNKELAEKEAAVKGVLF